MLPHLIGMHQLISLLMFSNPCTSTVLRLYRHLLCSHFFTSPCPPSGIEHYEVSNY